MPTQLGSICGVAMTEASALTRGSLYTCALLAVGGVGLAGRRGSVAYRDLLRLAPGTDQLR